MTAVQRADLQRLPPAVRTDLPVLAMLVLCWLALTVAAWAHLVTGLVLLVVIGVHLRSRWPLVQALMRGTGRSISVRRLVRRSGALAAVGCDSSDDRQRAGALGRGAGARRVARR